MAVVSAVAFATGIAWACAGPGAFACQDDAQCVLGSAQGTCEPDGFCSFPDDSCLSGRRYGERAPAETAHACVLPPDPTTDGATTGGDGADDGPEPDAGDDGVGTTAGVDADAGDVDDDGTTVATTGPTPGSSDDGGTDTSSGDEGPLPATCRVGFADEFDDASLDPAWGTWLNAGVTLEEQAGSLTITIPSHPSWVGAGVELAAIPMAGGWSQVRIDEVDQPGAEASVGLVFNSSACDLQLEIGMAGILAYSRVDGVFEGLATDAWSGQLPVWLRLRVDEGGVVYYEWSLDGTTWDELYAGSFPECDDGDHALMSTVFAGGYLPSGESLSRHVAAFARCEPI